MTKDKISSNYLENLQHEKDILEKVKKLSLNNSEFQKKINKESFKSNVYLYGFEYMSNLEEKDIEESSFSPIIILLKTAKINNSTNRKTEFPDYISENGIMEHFQIFSTGENKKGSEFLKKEMELERNLEKEITENNLWTSEMSYTIENQSFKNLSEMFKSKWKSHICSLDKYEGDKSNVCFLIENQDSFGLITEQKYDFENFKNITTGNILENYCNQNEYFNHFMLGRCKELLEYINKYKDKIHYVIFVTHNDIEIIKTKNIDYILSVLKDYDFYPTISVRNKLLIKSN